MTQRRQFKRILYVVAAVFAAIVLVDALDLFSNKNWSEIPHGNHSHYSPHNRDENVSVSDCPQRPPGENEMLSSQCQLIQFVDVDGATHYVPVDRNQNVPIDRFPTSPPGPGVIITATGELAAAGDH